MFFFKHHYHHHQYQHQYQYESNSMRTILPSLSRSNLSKTGCHSSTMIVELDPSDMEVIVYVLQPGTTFRNAFATDHRGDASSTSKSSACWWRAIFLPWRRPRSWVLVPVCVFATWPPRSPSSSSPPSSSSSCSLSPAPWDRPGESPAHGHLGVRGWEGGFPRERHLSTTAAKLYKSCKNPRANPFFLIQGGF